MSFLKRLKRFLTGVRPDDYPGKYEPQVFPKIIKGDLVAEIFSRTSNRAKFQYRTENKWVDDEMYARHFVYLLTEFTGVECKCLSVNEIVSDPKGWTRSLTIVSGLAAPVYYEVNFKIIPSISE